MEINKCEECKFRIRRYDTDYMGNREKVGDMCYHPDNLEWVMRRKWTIKEGRVTMHCINLYQGDFPENCPLETKPK